MQGKMNLKKYNIAFGEDIFGRQFYFNLETFKFKILKLFCCFFVFYKLIVKQYGELVKNKKRPWVFFRRCSSVLIYQKKHSLLSSYWQTIGEKNIFKKKRYSLNVKSRNLLLKRSIKIPNKLEFMVVLGSLLLICQVLGQPVSNQKLAS